MEVRADSDGEVGDDGSSEEEKDGKLPDVEGRTGGGEGGPGRVVGGEVSECFPPSTQSSSSSSSSSTTADSSWGGGEGGGGTTATPSGILEVEASWEGPRRMACEDAPPSPLSEDEDDLLIDGAAETWEDRKEVGGGGEGFDFWFFHQARLLWLTCKKRERERKGLNGLSMCVRFVRHFGKREGNRE